MSDTSAVELREDGVYLTRGATISERFRWASGKWTIRLVDNRLGPLPSSASQAVGALATMQGLVVRVTTLDSDGRDTDRKALGLPPDPHADPVLLTRPSGEGPVNLVFGSFGWRRCPVTDSTARAIITEAIRHGLEVGRYVPPSGRYRVRNRLVTEVTTSGQLRPTIRWYGVGLR